MNDRYARLEAIDWWDAALVRAAVAVVAGAGALGNEVVKNLVLVGWGTVVIVDHDVVEESNLSRSVFFQAADIGRPKAEVLAARAGAVNPDCRVLGLRGDLRTALSSGIVRRSGVVFGCLDSVGARVALNQLTRSAGRVLVDAGLTTWEGTVQVYPPEVDMPCYVCGLGEEDLRELALRRSCLAYERQALAAGGVPTTPTVASVTAGMAVQEGVKWLHRERPGEVAPAAGRELRIDLAHNRFWNFGMPANADCLLHWDTADVDRSIRPSWDSSWREVAQACRKAAGADGGALRLPARMLLRWACPHCGAAEEVLRAHGADGVLPCPECDRPVAPRFAPVVDGDEPWADRSPADTGFPPWTWLDLPVDDRVVTFELAGARGPVAVLDRGGDDGDASA